MNSEADPAGCGWSHFGADETPDAIPIDTSALVNARAEQNVIGAILYDSNWIDTIGGDLRPDDFADPLAGRIFAAVADAHHRGTWSNALTIAPLFEHDADFQDRGGSRLLIEASTGLLSSINPKASAGEVARLAERRRALDSMRNVVTGICDPSVPLADTQVAADEAWVGALRSSTSRPSLSLADAFAARMERIRALRRGEGDTGVRLTGLPEWDEITNGMKGGDVILLGGRPGMGKTATSLAVARRSAEAGNPTLFISLEMSTDQLMARLQADLLFEAGGRATYEDIIKGNVDESDLRRLDEIGRRIQSWPLEILDDPILNAVQLAPVIRRHQRRWDAKGTPLRLVIVDYLGLMQPPPGVSGKVNEVTAISLATKNAARQCNVPILMLAQLSRAVEQRDDKRPVLSDLRDSGSLEQDADVVIYVYRHEYYLGMVQPPESQVSKGEAWRTEMQAHKNRVEIYSAKNRFGALTRRKLWFFGDRAAIRADDYYRMGG